MTHLVLYLVECRMPIDEQDNLTNAEPTDFSWFVWSAHPEWVLPTWKRRVLRELAEHRIEEHHGHGVSLDVFDIEGRPDPVDNIYWQDAVKWYDEMSFEAHVEIVLVPTQPPKGTEGAACVVPWDEVTSIHPEDAF